MYGNEIFWKVVGNPFYYGNISHFQKKRKKCPIFIPVHLQYQPMPSINSTPKRFYSISLNFLSRSFSFGTVIVREWKTIIFFVFSESDLYFRNKMNFPQLLRRFHSRTFITVTIILHCQLIMVTTKQTQKAHQTIRRNTRNKVNVQSHCSTSKNVNYSCLERLE